jgi:dynein intermediate chain 3, axonemal
LEAPDDINSFQFNPSDANIIAGGCVNGQIVLWDISEYQDKLKSNRKTKTDGEEGGNGGTSAGGNGASGGGAGGVAGVDKQTEVVVPILKFMVASSIEFGHRGSISDLQWVNSAFTVSSFHFLRLLLSFANLECIDWTYWRSL